MAYQSYVDFSTNSANPFYLHPNENPALVLVSPPLDVKNYHVWARSMQIALISKNKDRFIDGSLPKPPLSDPLYAPWIRCNTMVLAWIQRSISESIAKSVLWIDNAAGVWRNLQVRFSHGDIFRISDIQEELYKFRQGTLDVSNYFTQMKVLWDELENYRPIPVCTCAIPCSCDAIASVQHYREQDYVLQFLKGLNDKFTHSKSQIMMLNPLPNIDKAFSLVIQQEREMNSSVSNILSPTGNTDEATALNVQAQSNHNSKPGYGNFKWKSQGTSPKGHARVCTHCNRTNHTIETCFLKHGFPPGYRGKSKVPGSSNTSQPTAMANTASENQSTGSSPASSCALTQEQYTHIMALLQQSQLNSQANSISTSPLALNFQSGSNGKNSNIWILDTGATDHICFDISLFLDHKNIVPIPVNLPNGSQVVASIAGTVVLSPSLTLHHVLFIPSFHVNLVSIAKLVDSNNCFVQFHANSCHIM